MAQITAINQATAVLGWDQQTYMPSGGGQARADQLEALSGISHQLLTASETERLLLKAEKAARSLDPDSDDAAFIRVARRDYDQAAKLPESLVKELASVTTLAHEHWAAARSHSKYAEFAPWLERIVGLTRRVAEAVGYADRPYDALLDQYEPGMKTADVEAMYKAIGPEIAELVKKIVDSPGRTVTDLVLRRDFDTDKQKQFGEHVVHALGFDFQRGRQDVAVHPFCTSFSHNDVRITTRYEKNWLPAALFGSMHETGHALYELGVSNRYDRNILEGGTSLGVHESQSRLWENLVGRSYSFWKYYYGDLQALFPESLTDTDLDTFYRSINAVSPSLIRVEADEVTYNLHTLIRFEIENELIEGRLSVTDAPDVWNSLYGKYLGITPPDDAHGILQDVHWSGGGIGYFPTYTIGNILSVQWYTEAEKSLGISFADQIEHGDFEGLRNWLTENIYQWGRKYKPTELVQRVTGRPMDTAPYLAYLKGKYTEIYDL
jgi:carboxypeptidase Taq